MVDSKSNCQRSSSYMAHEIIEIRNAITINLMYTSFLHGPPFKCSSHFHFQFKL